MHILYIHQHFVPPGGVGGTRSLEFARRLSAKGHTVTMVVSDAYYAETQRSAKVRIDELAENLSVRVVPVSYENSFGFLHRVLAFVRFAARASIEAMKVKDVDLVFATSTPLTVVLPGLVAKLRHRAPMVFEVRDLWPELPIAMGVLGNPVFRGAAKLMEYVAYRSSAKVVALSPGMKDGVVARGTDPDDVFVIPNSCDNALFRSPVDGAEPFLEQNVSLRSKRIVMYAGTLGEINGVDYVPRLAAEMKRLDPSVHFVVVGKGKDRKNVESVAQELGVLGVNMTIIDPIAKAEMPHVLAAADVLLSLFIDLPEMWNNSANKFFDALASATPVAINYGGWQAHVLQESGAGIVLPPEPGSLAAERLLEFLNDGRRLARASEAAGDLADHRFSRDRLADELNAVLEGVHQA